MEDVKFYQKSWFMWVMLIIVPPVGIYITWRSEGLKTPMKVILSVIFGLWFIGIIYTGVNNKTGNAHNSKPAATESKSTDKKVDNKEKENKEDKKKKEEVKSLGVNDTYKYKDEYEFVINKVYTTKDRNQFEKKEAKNVVIINYSYKNISKKDNLFISEMNFKAFDANGNALSTYPVFGEDMAKAVPTGKSSNGSMTYALNEGDTIDLYYYDNMFNSKEDAVFNVKIEE